LQHHQRRIRLDGTGKEMHTAIAQPNFPAQGIAHARNKCLPPVILGLRTGCCPDPVPGPDGRPGRHLIRGHEFKTAIDEDGNHQSGGAEREAPWVAIAPVVNAIRVLERMVPAGHLLFDHHAHDLPSSRARTGSLKVTALRERIEDFVTWANREAASHGVAGEVIPADSHGNIGLSRFRRSLAWHIARRPNGLVALAIQYGHMRTAFDWKTEGYGSRSRDGIHDLIDLETARAVADTVAALHDDLGNGGGVSGPAARRAIRAAATAPRHPDYPGQRPQAAEKRGRHALRQPACPRALPLQAGPGPLPPRRGEGHPQPRPLRPRLRQHRPHYAGNISVSRIASRYRHGTGFTCCS
jgi:hypothetical protein